MNPPPTDAPDRVHCDQCGWAGAEGDQLEHPRHEGQLCPTCWAEGFIARPRPQLGPLLEAVLDHEPGPRTPKPLCDWTEAEWATSLRTERAREAHEASPVRLPTHLAGFSQLGLDFMRPEFRIAPAAAPPGRHGRRRLPG